MPTSACKLAYNALRVQPKLACFLKSTAKVQLFFEYAKVFLEKLLKSVHFIAFVQEMLLRGYGMLHALACGWGEIGGDGIGGDDAEVARAAQRGPLGIYKAVAEVLEACDAGNLLQRELYDKAYIAVCDAHV